MNSIIDLNWLKETYEDDLDELIRIYRMESKTSLGIMKSAYQNGDFNEMKRMAHKMKGSFRILNLKEIEKVAAALEIEDDQTKYEELVFQLEKMHTLITNELNNLK